MCTKDSSIIAITHDEVDEYKWTEPHRLGTAWCVRPTNPRTSQCIHAVWSESLLGTLWVANLLTVHHYHDEDWSDIVYRCNMVRSPSKASDQHAHPRSVTRVFTRLTRSSQGFCSSYRQRKLWSDLMITYNLVWSPSKASDQPAHPRSLTSVFARRTRSSQGSCSSYRQRILWSELVELGLI